MWTVSGLTQRIAASLEDLGAVDVKGELSQIKVSTAGHFYATLKDKDAVLSIVMWRTTLARSGKPPAEGSLVTVRGTLSVYPPRGGYQLVITKIEAQGQGDLAARLQALKEKLAAAGLFDDDKKRDLPFLPRAVGVATAAGSAALADILTGLRTRFPGMPVVHAPCPVQGPQSAPGIVEALRQLGQDPRVDVIICGRGGGSLEDLWAFNEESVVRAIANCPVPVVSAVGHETDWTLADLAADLRAKTPTAAAELVVPIREELEETVKVRRLELTTAMEDLLTEARTRLAALASHRALSTPRHQVDLRIQRLDELRARLDDGIANASGDARARWDLLRSRLRGAAPNAPIARAKERLAGAQAALVRAGSTRMDRAKERLAAAAGRLDALSPLAVIGRGYAVLRTPEGRLIRTLADAPVGSALQARTTDGWLEAEVTGARRQKLNEPETPYEV